ncbi:acyl-CoA dehydrogenase family protein [Pseudofrankia inefficax]|uniref:Acyl-CoA dehydrogenase domain-containing protein n=1 Tax=Pseudofrankia inefficax (strain DSM 45817 / CECT 9037 / DDB 130130 / EuI1c) TaxID=298654 RepID=E3IU56_PSEI1|nr:acyl-CoA dehydrogenase family protein [Pseudofrankia inefficax]ADP81249.1 acyl-CoA dehydrogenase domain-containing protein [Pseudofrankia inefficax]
MELAEPVLTEEQRALRAATSRFARAQYPLSRVREVADSGAQVPSDYLRQAAELGWFAMLVPEKHGGGTVSGRPGADAVVIAQERGRWLQPVAFVPANVVALALAEAGDESQQGAVLPGVLEGVLRVSWAFADDRDTGALGAVTYARTAGGLRLSGLATPVQDADLADVLLVTATGPDGVAQALVRQDTPGLTVTALASLDVTRRFGSVRFDGVEVAAADVVGEVGEAAGALAQRQLDLAAVLTAAEMVGAMSADLELAIDYAKSRTAFGRPIGSFQALKHQLADAAALVEAGKAAVDAAAEALDGTGPGDAASVAKAFVSRAAVEVAHTCWQVFGGIAFTWEHDQHLYLRRLTTDAALYGDEAHHYRRVLALHDLPDAPPSPATPWRGQQEGKDGDD